MSYRFIVQTNPFWFYYELMMLLGKFQMISGHVIKIYLRKLKHAVNFFPRRSVKMSADSGTYLQQAKASTSQGPVVATGGQSKRDKFVYIVYTRDDSEC